MSFGVAIVTISDSASQGDRHDESGDVAQQMLQGAGLALSARTVVPDERTQIAETLRQWSTSPDIRCIVTTGGTGMGPRDVTPEATMDVVEFTLPGMAEAMRAESLKKTPFAMLSRQVVGARGDTLIVNLPGSPKAVRECLTVILPVLPHAVALLAGHTAHD